MGGWLGGWVDGRTDRRIDWQIQRLGPGVVDVEEVVRRQPPPDVPAGHSRVRVCVVCVCVCGVSVCVLRVCGACVTAAPTGCACPRVVCVCVCGVCVVCRRRLA